MSFSTDELIAMVEDALTAKPDRLPEWVQKIRGWGTTRVSAFLNALCSHDETHYLEFGTYCGRSLCAAAYGNTGVFTGVDNFTQGFSLPRDTILSVVKANVDRVLAECRPSCQGGPEDCGLHLTVQVKQGDCLAIPPPAADVFFLDADHSFEATRAGVAFGLSYGNSVLVVDDYRDGGYPDVAGGVWAGLYDAKAVVHREWTLRREDGWHAGLFVGVVSR
jgi:hypothetical protein